MTCTGLRLNRRDPEGLIDGSDPGRDSVEQGPTTSAIRFIRAISGGSISERPTLCSPLKATYSAFPLAARCAP